MGPITTIISSLVGGAGSLLSGFYGYVAVAAVAGGLAGWATFGVVHNADLTKYQALQLKDAANVTAVLEQNTKVLTDIANTQRALDAEVTAGAVAEAKAQESLHAQTVYLSKEVPVYITPYIDTMVVPCVPYGLVRVLDAAIFSANGNPVSPSDLALPAGKSDNDCAPVKASALGDALVEDLGIAGENAEQLNALIAKASEIIATANKEPPK